jgi:hypothetical protein
MEQIHHMMIMSLLKLQATISTLFAGAMAIILIVLVDSAELILLCYAMILMHVGSGYCLSWKMKSGWSEDKWFRTGMKFFWFPLVILANGLVQHKFNLPVPLSSIVAAYLIIHDLKGFLTNVGKLTGTDIWNQIVSKIKNNT